MKILREVAGEIEPESEITIEVDDNDGTVEVKEKQRDGYIDKYRRLRSAEEDEMLKVSNLNQPTL